MNSLDPGLLSLIDCCTGKPLAVAALRDLRKFQHGIDNILSALEAAPGLPIETLSREDQEKWTDIITGILMALGPYQATGKPLALFEAINDRQEP